VMRQDTERMRRAGDTVRPFVMTNLKTQEGLQQVVAFIEQQGLLAEHT